MNGKSNDRDKRGDQLEGDIGDGEALVVLDAPIAANSGTGAVPMSG